MPTIIEDTRQKIGQHKLKNDMWAAHGVNVIRCQMPYGDYMLAPTISVDTKRDIMELAQNLKADHRRFRDAAIKAQESGTHMVILVENEDGIKSLNDLERWVEPENSFHVRVRRNVNAERYRGKDIRTAKDGHKYDVGIAYICRKMSHDYGIEFDFCTPTEAWAKVMEHLGVIM